MYLPALPQALSHSRPIGLLCGVWVPVFAALIMLFSSRCGMIVSLCLGL